MFKKLLFYITIICFSGLQAQEINLLYKSKKILPSSDTIYIEKTSINSSFFKLLDANGQQIDNSKFKINFKKATLLLTDVTSSDSITVQYLQFPELLTKEYRIYDASRVVENQSELGDLYAIENRKSKTNVPFDGLNSSGSITRGITIGNNQNAVLNSNLDLQITGKISEKVSLRASIQDSNIPLQDGGYSQKLDQFDNVFMEIFSDKWNIRAGDVFLENRNSQFLNFNKKVQGLSTSFNFGSETNKTNVFASASIVRGQYAKSTIIGQEGNQGPYKLKGQNGELYVLVISGSERVYVNGLLLKRGENNDYTIDYNAGEIVFTPLFTINSEMRIAIEYQYSDRNYTRFVTYAGATHENKSWSFGGYLYSENDQKNQPLQQNLSPEQAQILVQSGDNINLMVAPSAFADFFSENKVLYQKTVVNAVEIFQYSNDPQAELFNVRFSLVGANNGNYIVINAATIARVFQYVEPINGIPQGNYDPIIPLVAPTKIQVATFLGKYKPTEKTAVDFEIGVSNNDRNLFSAIDDANNKGLASKINAKQRLLSKKWNLDAFANYQFIQKDFRPIERLYTIEFDRDWNLGSAGIGNQSLLISGLQLDLNPKANSTNHGKLLYQFEKLDFSDSFSGNRQIINGLFKLKKWTFINQGSFLKSESTDFSSQFLRNQSQIRFHFGKNWIGSTLQLEDNKEKNKVTNQFSALSQKFTEYGIFTGRGDSTKVYVELGYLKRSNDSLQSGIVQRVNASHSFQLRSKLIQNTKSDLAIYANYRVLNFEESNVKKESTLNSRIVYTDRFLGQLIQSTTVYETNSGSIPQQEFTYLEVAAGQGVYTWNDYNSNGVQELQEFEIAPFLDQAKFIRVFLPNRIFIKTHQNKFSQSFTLNPNQWQNAKGVKKLLSYFYNQTAFIIDRKNQSDGTNFELNPFSTADNSVLGLNSSLRNSLFYNRGKQDHSLTYTYLDNKTKNLLSVGSQEATNNSHQLQYAHLYKKNWLLGFFTKTILTTIQSENFPEKNFDINGYQVAPKISYLFSKNSSWDLFYEYQYKNNQIGVMENLIQSRFGSAFSYASDKKFTINSEVSFVQNKFDGNEFSAVGFQMLEGLQTGQNLTWKLLLQKNITQFLDINFNYQGRKSETSQAIHTGNVQLRAYF
ncbi:hypothetical protein SAMN05444372_111101 [Flavobacterium micromati]|uniref:Uncharacterized protein n=1 Tax=Flavobacterium micromati TaxID=229205 RepID=A0A1M5NJC3_9FLAO|nr:hypothetical protein [Flavobacterium micromati]SHG89666.1 hypothetical protein SAMN05444372_111101 [Flavobacterium micromati]